MAGKLYLVPTPIGNLKDITVRALEVLENVDIIAAEDTRQSLKLLNHYNIKKTLFSYHQHNENSKGEEIINKLRDGMNVAVISDAGSPGISDPGAVVVKRCIEEGLAFEVLPGATAFTTALIYSGIDTTKFVFRGFLSKDNKEKKQTLEEIKGYKDTIILYEAPHRLLQTLTSLREYLGNREMAACRELTKLYEEICRGSIEECIEHFVENRPRGEFVLVISGKSDEEIKREEQSTWENLSIIEHLEVVIAEGNSKKDAVKLVAKARELPKQEVYKYSTEL